MAIQHHRIQMQAPRQGMHEITAQIQQLVEDSARNAGESDSGLCHLFLMHTSASLTIQENADPSARRDLENFLERLIEPYSHFFTHTSEGPDDMPSHIKSILTHTQLTIPFERGRLLLGTWQGVYLWEHRVGTPKRTLVVSVQTNG